MSAYVQDRTNEPAPPWADNQNTGHPVEAILRGVNDLRSALHEAEARVKALDTEKSGLQEQCKTATLRAEKAEKSAAHLQAQFNSLIQQVQEREARLRDEISRLSRARQLSQAEADQVAQAKARIRSLETLSNQLRAKVTDAQNDAAQARNSLKARDAEFQRAIQDRERAQDAARTAHADLHQALAKTKAVESDLSDLRRDYENAIREKREREVEHRRAEEDIQRRTRAELELERQRGLLEAREKLDSGRRGEIEAVKQQVTQHYEQFIKLERLRWSQVLRDREAETGRLRVSSKQSEEKLARFAADEVELRRKTAELASAQLKLAEIAAENRLLKEDSVQRLAEAKERSRQESVVANQLRAQIQDFQNESKRSKTSYPLHDLIRLKEAELDRLNVELQRAKSSGVEPKALSQLEERQRFCREQRDALRTLT